MILFSVEMGRYCCLLCSAYFVQQVPPRDFGPQFILLGCGDIKTFRIMKRPVTALCSGPAPWSFLSTWSSFGLLACGFSQLSGLFALLLGLCSTPCVLFIMES